MIKEERKKKKRVKKILIALLVFLLMLLIAAAIVIKVFVVKNVKVEGNILYDEQLIKETVLNDDYSWNSLYVLLKYTFVEAEDLPFIDTVEVKLNDPQTITIKVYEKGMMGYIYISAIGENAYFDKDGFVVEISSRVIENVPRIDGIACDEVVQYEQLPIDEQQLKQILTLTQSLKREDLEPDSINYSSEDELVLYYGDVAIRLGSIENLTQKVEHLSKILPNLSDKAGVLHMENWTEDSVNIIFEIAPEVEDIPEEEQEPEISSEAESETSTEADSGEESEPSE